MTLDAALTYNRSLKQGESFTYTKVAEKFGISRTTLSTHHQTKSASKLLNTTPTKYSGSHLATTQRRKTRWQGPDTP